MNEFAQIILHFYRHVIQNHPNKYHLITKIYSLILVLKHQQHQKTASPIHASLKPKSEQVLSPTKNNSCELSIMQTAKEWGCEWCFVVPQFSKMLTYVILHNLILTENFWQFQRIRESVNLKLQSSGLAQPILSKLSVQWGKVSKLLLGNKNESWEQKLPDIVKRIPKEIQNYVLQSYSLFQIDKNDLEKVRQGLKQLAFKLKIKIRYFQLQSKRIIINDTFGLSSIQYNVGFVESIDKFVVANKFPQISQRDKRKLQTLQHFQSNLAELLHQYDQNSNKLSQIESIKNYIQVQSKIKEFINTKK